MRDKWQQSGSSKNSTRAQRAVGCKLAMMKRARAGLLLATLVLAVTAVGCPCLGIVVNPSSELRWWLFSNFGAKRICPEMLQTSVPLRLQERATAMGRFFPQRCSASVNDKTRTVTVRFGGTGYGYTPVSRRVGFAVDAAVQYRMDFRISDEGAYVWGIFNRATYGPTFRLLSVENKLAGAAAAPFGVFNNVVGQQIVHGGLTRGFTVLHTDKGNQFALGILRPPRKPYAPMRVASGEHFTYANESIAVHAGQRDYLGPFRIHESGQRLALRAVLQGVPVDVMVVPKRTGDMWRNAYQSGAPLGPPPGPVVGGGVLSSLRPMRAAFRLPPGSYYVVVDNTRMAGRVGPRGNSTVSISYVAQLID